jgi:ABC-type multidrug transport system ATPase subunit
MNSFAGGPGAVIEARGLTKRYGSKVAVDDQSFTEQPGRVTGFLGPNGAGKSSTMRLLLGLDRPDSGAATIAGKRYRDLRDPMRQGFGVLCLWTAALLAVAGFLVARRDA